MFVKLKIMQFLLMKYFTVSMCELFARVRPVSNILLSESTTYLNVLFLYLFNFVCAASWVEFYSVISSISFYFKQFKN
jgi:hypothetical protein